MKKRKFILAARDDGFGERMCCILNAMYISKKTSLKFRFVWKSKEDSLVKVYNNKDKFLTCNDQIPIEVIFSHSFIKKYHYDNFNVSPLDNFHLFINRSIKELSLKPYEYHWGWRSCQANLANIFYDVKWKDYQNTLNQCWKEIEFSNKFQEIINQACILSNKIGRYLAVHIRSGDLIFEEKGYGRWLWFAANKALSFHLALELILKKLNNFNIIIFTDDIESGRQILDYVNKIKSSSYECILAYNLFKDEEDNSVYRTFFEIVTMSKAIEIYSSGDSGFSRMACFIGQSKMINIYKLLNSYQQLNYISNNLKKLILNKYQMSYSYFLLFLRSKEKLLSMDKQLQYLQKGYEWNRDNYIFILCEIDVYLNYKKFDKANKLLNSVLNIEFNSIANLLLQKSYDLKRYDNFLLFSAYSKCNVKKFQYINLMKYVLASDMLKNIELLGNFYNFDQINLISLLSDRQAVQQAEIDLKRMNICSNYMLDKKKYNLLFLMRYSLAARFFNRLDYRLGKCLLDAKEIRKIIFLPFNLYLILKDYKNFLNDYKKQRKKDISLKILPMH
ncbi:capsule biosynthesis protein CapA, partial [Campylobacter jejuni]|nr:capsule biosynthesis protein CapA [Campylobacter jejuni]